MLSFAFTLLAERYFKKYKCLAESGKVFLYSEEAEMLKEKAIVLDGDKLSRTTVRISHEIAERNADLKNLVLVGIKTRGVPFAKRIAANVEKFYGEKLAVGELDITLYRDDLSELAEFPKVKNGELGADIVGKDVVLCDDVIFTGRTARAAIDALLSHGRPKTVQLAVVADRGHREFPIKPDFVGKNVPTALSEVVSVKFKETDGEDGVTICERP